MNALHFVAQKVGKTNHTIGNTNKWNGHNKTLREKLKYVEKMCVQMKIKKSTHNTQTQYYAVYSRPQMPDKVAKRVSAIELCELIC